VGIKDQPKFFDWQTPPVEVDRIHRAFGSIDLDPATSLENPTRARYFYAPYPTWFKATGPYLLGPCGLSGSWERGDNELLYANFRYGKFIGGLIDPAAPVIYKDVVVGYGTGWGAKLAQDRGEWLTLVPCSPDAPWWKALAAACSWRVDTAKRISFVDPRTGEIKKGNKASSTWFYRGPRIAVFREFYAPLGEEAPGRRLLSQMTLKEGVW
jgi:hypothetical protein